MFEKNVGNQPEEQPGSIRNELPVFTLSGGQIENKVNKPNLVQIKKAIDALDTDKGNSYIILEISPPINGSSFIQTLKYIRSKDGKYSYIVEIQFDYSSDHIEWKQYQKLIEDVNEVKILFEDYFINKKTPDVTGWDEIYHEIKNEKKSSDSFDIMEVCSRCVRKNDNLIFNGHGIKHGCIIDGKTIYQPMGEALTLLAEIIDSGGKYGDVYYSTDKKRFYCDIVFPRKWPGRNRNIPKFHAYHRRDTISITALNKENKQVFLKIKPLKTANRLLPCLILLAVAKLMNNETYLESAIDYFLNLNYSNFVKFYQLVFSDFTFKKYQIYDSYDGKENDYKFDLDDYLSFSSMCRIIMENKRVYNKSAGLL